MDKSEADGDILGRVYDAAIQPELWSPLLRHISDRVGGASAYLIFQDQVTGQGRSLSVRADPAQQGPYFGYFGTRNPLLKIRDFPSELRVMTDEEKLPKDELVRTEYYNDFARPFGIHSTLMWRLAIEKTHTAVLNVCRPANWEPFGGPEIEWAKRLHPHLVRAFRLSSKLSSMEWVRSSLEDLLDRSAHAVFVVDPRATICHVNRCGEILLAKNCGLGVRGGVLCASTHDATRKLHALVAAAGSTDRKHRTGGDLSLGRPGRPLPLTVTVIPARREDAALFVQPSVLVSVGDPDARTAVTDLRLRDAFGLSRAEARVTALLLEGRNTKEAARELGLSVHTVRGHLARIFAKTGANRQAELVRLITKMIGHV